MDVLQADGGAGAEDEEGHHADDGQDTDRGGDGDLRTGRGLMQDNLDGRLLLDEVAADRHAICEVLDLRDRMRRNPGRRKIIVQLICDAVLARALRQ